MVKNQSHKIALYIRVSTEEQASNPEGSIKSQEQRLRQHVEFKNLEGNFGEVTAVFIDRGKSGKNTNRAELQRLLKSIREKEVNLVLVTELSRLSRSIKDFSEIWELMRSLSCGFQSLREQFDTTTAAGEMVLFTMANLAQFERKQTSERITANFKARAERGLFNGGSIPVGYKRHPEKKGYLVIDEEEAQIVREAYNAFLEEGCLSKAGLSLNNKGHRIPKRRGSGNRPRLGHFTIENLHDILTNPIYAGRRKINTNGEIKTVKAVWEAIISELTFQRVQSILKKNYRRHKSHSERRFPYQLSGIFFCHRCKDRLCGKTAHGRMGKVPYYEHTWSTRKQACLNKKFFVCHPNRIQAKVIEKHVWERVEELLTKSETAEFLINRAKTEHAAQIHVTETDKARNKLRGIDEQIEALAEHLTKIPKGVSPVPVFNQMQKLENLKTETQKDLQKLGESGISIDEPAALKDYRAYLSGIKEIIGLSNAPELKTKIIKLLVAKVELLPGSFKVHYFVGKSVTTLIDTGGGGQTSASGIKASYPFLNCGSNSLTNGGRRRARTCDLRRVKDTKHKNINN